MENSTEVTEFIFVGITDDPKLQLPLFFIFTLIYLLTLIGNLGMTVLIIVDSHLHMPMYLFLSNLSLADLGYSTAVTPKVMAQFLMGNNIISFNACATQLYFFVVFITVENFLLSVMAFDRYAAVCKPLHYTTIMTTGVCEGLIIGCYALGFLTASIHVWNIFSLSFCRANVINHFFCDGPPVLALSCSDIHKSEKVIFIFVCINVMFSTAIILVSYLFIFVTILKMHSSEGHQKAFSTCASHLTAISIFYGTVVFMYLQSNSNRSLGTDKLASVFYAIVIPMLNPLVYSLRNKEVKSAFKRTVGKAKSSVRLLFLHA
ncbi:olfactory receptor 5B12-like [Talpa occidentalis]|uniref:olfactory receptor 5B12-like n=1 Tax=Talpa occidentalis TaxID=50954 RepID=UPI00188DD105|nr:olfactory receptor 5B12-like [Talpa occidentalis]